MRVAIASATLAELQVKTRESTCNLWRKLKTLWDHSIFLDNELFWQTVTSWIPPLFQVRVNDPNTNRPLFTTGLIGRDNAIARHGIHGLYWLYHVNIPATKLLEGENTIFLKQPRCQSPFQGFMYDYIRLEGPPSS